MPGARPVGDRFDALRPKDIAMRTLARASSFWTRRLPFLLTALFAPWVNAQPLPIEHLVGLDEYEEVRLSPTGEYLALTVPFADRTALAMVRLSDGQQLGSIQHGRGIYIDDFDWVGPDRIMYSIGERFGRLKAPQSTGELFAVDVDGKAHASLIGFRAGKGTSSFSHIKRAKSEPVFARLVAPLASDAKSALISVQELTGRELPFSRVERIDVRTGSRIVVATAPVANARFLTDHANRVRFAWGSDTDNVQHVYQRDHDEAEWGQRPADVSARLFHRQSNRLPAGRRGQRPGWAVHRGRWPTGREAGGARRRHRRASAAAVAVRPCAVCRCFPRWPAAHRVP
jgi:hypothetical protein